MQEIQNFKSNFENFLNNKLKQFKKSLTSIKFEEENPYKFYYEFSVEINKLIKEIWNEIDSFNLVPRYGFDYYNRSVADHDAVKVYSLRLMLSEYSEKFNKIKDAHEDKYFEGADFAYSNPRINL